MDKLTYYRELVIRILEKYAQVKPLGDIEVETFFDQENNHYQVFHRGWINYRRVFGPLIHIDLIDDKIWIQHDGTQTGVANQLMELDVPKEDIVLGFHPPLMRQYDGFAMG
ncbi:XisI protein [Geminocystis herdmanii]|uniref:XisI protein n=1 Tax=Geminocystis herdmanii TaxID=669359 RepID=UPI00034B19B9|nr:XisI protein [Geminocystis herdmanii]